MLDFAGSVSTSVAVEHEGSISASGWQIPPLKHLAPPGGASPSGFRQFDSIVADNHNMRVLIAVSVAGLLCFGPAKADMHWRPRSDAAWRDAKEQGRPLLIEVWADWCRPCQRMDREVWSDARVIAAARKFVQVSVDISRADMTSAESLIFGTHGVHPIQVLPTIILLDPWGDVILFNEGYIQVSELAPMLNEVPADYNPVRTARESLLSDRNNSRALVTVGLLYQRSTAYGVANRYYREALTKAGAKENERQREEILFGIAMNEVRRADWKSARKELERFRREFAGSTLMDQVLFGLVVTDLRQNKTKDATQHLSELRSAFPQSDATASAGRMVERGRTAR